ncbi:hypothetical protein H0H92_013650 [Tricholoma furcatifolium]|nr:hypothetical protein H0H92_013650 [Tricholoma furcatifolium]
MVLAIKVMDNSIFALLVVAAVVSFGFLRPRKRLNTPPIVNISHEALFRHPRQAYESALEQHGSVIGVYRKNRVKLEYIVDESHVQQVLTNDALFSAERGTAAILNMPILNMLPYSLIGSLDKLVNKGVTPILERLLLRLGPVFQRYMFALATQADGAEKPVPVELAHSVHEAMAESMLLLIIGEKEPDHELITAAIKVAFDVAIVGGIYQNIGYWSRTFPTTWRVFTWIRLMIFTIPWTFRRIGWRVWNDLRKARETGNTDHIDPLAVRREILPELRQELSSIMETDPDTGKPSLTYSSLRNAELLDSFIREVLRMKGDTIAVFRTTTQDVPLGGYVIPKGSLITPLATLSHESTKNWGEDAKEFIGNRWVGTDKTAVSISASYWPFGLGRFACPGRTLAIAEIKLMVLSLISRVDIFMEGGKYEIIDPLNTVAVPPRGQLLFFPLDKPLL